MSGWHTAPIVILLLFLSCGTTMRAASQDSESDGLPWLKASGRWIIDEDGNFVLLRGADYMGMEFGWFWHSEEDFERMRSWGFNVVRLPIAWSYVEPTEGHYDDSYLSTVATVISWCMENGLYVILDMHQWNWAPKFEGNGLPDWAVEQYSDQDEAKFGFFTDAATQGKFFDMWRHVANRFKNESTIFAYDIFNEPNVDYRLMSEESFLEELLNFYQGAADHIREVDNRHAVMYEPPWGGGVSDWSIIDDPNLVLSTHLYTEGTADGVTGYDGNSATLEEDFLVSYDFSTLWNVPLVIGEFGVGSAATKAHEWARDFMNIFDKYVIGACWWSYWRDDDSMGLLTADGEEKEGLLSALIRIYPCRFNITPTGTSYNITANYSKTDWNLDTEETVVATFRIPPKIGGNFTKSTNYETSSFTYYQNASELLVTLHGQGMGFVELGEKPKEQTVEVVTRSVFRDPLFVSSLTLNIVLLLAVIILRNKHARTQK